MRVQAKARNLSISAQKLRLCTGGMRGLNANVALQQLSAQPKKGSAMVFDTVHSAMANAQHNHNLLPAQLVIEEIYVDGGAKLKRWRPRSRGMTSAIIHPKAHLTVILAEQVKPDTKEPTKKSKKVKGA